MGAGCGWAVLLEWAAVCAVVALLLRAFWEARSLHGQGALHQVFVCDAGFLAACLCCWGARVGLDACLPHARRVLRGARARAAACLGRARPASAAAVTPASAVPLLPRGEPERLPPGDELPGGGSVQARQAEEADQEGASLTKQHYLEFLVLGRRLFLFLSVVSVSSAFFIWDSGLLFTGRMQGTVVINSMYTAWPREPSNSSCQLGFPGNGSEVITDGGNGSEARGFIVSSRVAEQRGMSRSREPCGALSAWHAPAEWLTSEEHAPDPTFRQCAFLATLCNASDLAYVPPMARGDVNVSDPAQCWLFRSVVEPAQAGPEAWLCKGEDTEGQRTVAVLALTLVYGVAAASCGVWQVRQTVTHHKKLRRARAEGNTLWLRQVPRARRDGKPFEIEEEGGFKEIGQDLAKEIAKKIAKQTGVAADPCVLGVHVARAERRRADTSASTRQLSGHAFVVLAERRHAASLLDKAGGFGCSLKALRRHALFNFGKPPWAAVTLTVSRAPPAEDIVWENLHLEKHWLVDGIVQFIVFCIMLWIANLELLVSVLYLGFHRVLGCVGQGLGSEYWRYLDELFDMPALSSYWEYLINSLLLPVVIELMSRQRSCLHSKNEKFQFEANFFYLIFNSMIVPALGGGSLPYLIELLSDTMVRPSDSIVRKFAQLSGSNLQFSCLTYLMSAALISTGSQWIQLGQKIMQALRGLCCRDGPSEPEQFAWGYWHAWSSSVLTLTLCMSVLMPSATIFGWSFFFLMGCAHRRVLDHKSDRSFNFFQRPLEMDAEPLIGITAVLLRTSVPLFWVLMAIFLNWDGDTETMMHFWSPLSLERVSVPLLFEGGPIPMSAILWTTLIAALCTFCVAFWIRTRVERRFDAIYGDSSGCLHAAGRRCSIEFPIAFVVGILVYGLWSIRKHFWWRAVQVPLATCAMHVLLVGALLMHLSSHAVRFIGQRMIRLGGDDDGADAPHEADGGILQDDWHYTRCGKIDGGLWSTTVQGPCGVAS